jgi:hypothetical protein
MSVSLSQILELVGELNDNPGEQTPRERFRRFLEENINKAGQIRDYVQECLRNTEDQYNRALQDLVNHIGKLLGFKVTPGRYKGVQGEVGYDGLWESQKTGFFIVIEVKKTEVYTIDTLTVIGYVDALISKKIIKSWDDALGLYVVGQYDPRLRQLENNIIAEKRTHQLSIIELESLLTLLELMSDYDVSHEHILSLLKPPGPKIDTPIRLMGSITAAKVPTEEEKTEPSTKEEILEKGEQYWITPVREEEEESAEKVIKTLVGEEKIYAFGDRTPGRSRIRLGDWICFYASGNGVIAHAKVASLPERKQHTKVRHPEQYPWTFRLKDVQLYLKDSVVIDASLRERMDAFKNRDPNKTWAWFVQATHDVTKHDFQLLTKQKTAE